jgi:predicted PurR-regulated permease PerM
MAIISILIGILALILLALIILMPVFIYSISNRANEQMKWNEAQLEAQNKILQELYNIRIK